MKYMIVELDGQNSIDLKKILATYQMLNYIGSFQNYEGTVDRIQKHPPDVAFIRFGKVELNAIELIGEIRRQNPFLRVILISDYKKDAIDAFEYGADGFILLPFDTEKIKQMMTNNIRKRKAYGNPAGIPSEISKENINKRRGT